MRRRVPLDAVEPPRPECCPYGTGHAVMWWRVAFEDAAERARVFADACPHERAAIEDWQARSPWRVP